MKRAEIIIKIGLAIAAVAGIAFLVVKYMDAIKAWAEKLCPCCQVEDEEELVEEPAAEAVTGKGGAHPGLNIAVVEAPGAKCPRCWKHSTAAGADDLCPRCAGVVAKIADFGTL